MMRLERFVSMLVISLLALGLTPSAFSEETPKGELSAGWQFVRVMHGSEFRENLPGGWYLDLAGNVHSALGFVGQVGGSYKTVSEGSERFDLKLHSFMGGLRVGSRRNPKVNPFVQFLAGGINAKVSAQNFSDSSTDPAIQFGGGINFTPGRVGFRIGVDYLRAFLSDEERDANVLRFVMGIVIPLGR